jgi:BirA family biotin operon repressor/biotin-[acetyl-CoA-carboxylase] ligase
MNFSVDGRPPLEPARLVPPAPYRVEVLPSVSSTNSEVVSRFLGGETEGLVIATEHQTEGRGRLDREWVTPQNSSITVSLLLTPDVPAERWTWLPLLTGLAASRAITEVTSLEPALKWPNDVLVNGSKAGGILLERVDHDGRAAAVVGIGINVHQTQEELPVPEATSLALAGAAVDRTALLGAVITAFANEYNAWVGGADPRERYRAACDTIGRETIVHTINEDLHGTVVDIDESGQLVLETKSDTLHLAVGDVEYVRPQRSV